jgi:hypothetical protein
VGQRSLNVVEVLFNKESRVVLDFWVDFRIQHIKEYVLCYFEMMEGIMNRTRRSLRSMVSSVDDDDNDDDGSTPFYAAAIIKAAIPRISSRSTRNTKPRCLHLAPSKV